MSLIKKVSKGSLDVVKRLLYMFAERDPVYIFHHIPKCGGTSLNKILDSWFITIRDYRSGWTLHYPEKIDINRLRSCHCLSGHFELDGFYLHQRYPEVFMSSRYRVFTFVRDPLQVQLSLFHYEKMNNHSHTMSLEEHLSIRPNYLANRFQVNFDNYKSVIDRYCFVGILEESEACIAILASIMGKRVKPLPWINKSRKDISINARDEDLSQELMTWFRNENTLDYLVYDYCVEKFNIMLAEQDGALD